MENAILQQNIELEINITNKQPRCYEVILIHDGLSFDEVNPRCIVIPGKVLDSLATTDKIDLEDIPFQYEEQRLNKETSKSYMIRRAKEIVRLHEISLLLSEGKLISEAVSQTCELSKRVKIKSRSRELGKRNKEPNKAVPKEAVPKDATKTTVRQGKETGKQFLQHKYPKYNPVNKSAKLHKKEMWELGLSDFDELPFDYYEKALPGESWQELSKRRQEECANFRAWMKKERTRQNLHPKEDSESECDSESEVNEILGDCSSQVCNLPKEQGGCKEVAIEVLETENSQLKSQLETANQKVASLERKIGQQKSSIEKLKEEIDKTNSNLNERNEVIEVLQSRMEEMERVFAANTEKMKEYELQLIGQSQAVNSEQFTEAEGRVRQLSRQLNSTLVELDMERALRSRLEEQLKATSNKPPSGSTETISEEAIAARMEEKLEQMKNSLMMLIEDKLRVVNRPRIHIPPTMPHISEPLLQAGNEGHHSSTPIEEFQLVQSRRWKRPAGRVTAHSTYSQVLQRPNNLLETASTVQSRGSMFNFDRTQDIEPTGNDAAKQNNRQQDQAGSRHRRQKRKAQKRTVNAQQNPPISQKLKRLILPANSGRQIVDMLEEAGIQPEEIGVTGMPISFPSGAVLVKVVPEKEAELMEALKKVGLRTKEATKPLPYEYRIHLLPENITEEAVQKAISNVATEPMINIKLYRPKADTNLQSAYIVCNDEHYSQISTHRRIRIGWRYFRLDTIPRLVQCRQCTLLGHTTKHCPYDQTTATRWKLEAENPEAPCANCRVYNTTLEGNRRGNAQKRSTDHPTNARGCTTRKKMLHKYHAVRKTMNQNPMKADDVLQDG